MLIPKVLLVYQKKKKDNKENKLNYMFAFFLRTYASNSCLHLEWEKKNQEPPLNSLQKQPGEG